MGITTIIIQENCLDTFRMTLLKRIKKKMTTTPCCARHRMGEYYTCDTCSENMKRRNISFGSGEDKLYICKECAETCHKGHKVRVAGTQHFHCECPMSYCKVCCKCCGDKEKCTATKGGRSTQRAWICETCHKTEYICNACKERCHYGHKLTDMGIQTFRCACGPNCKAVSPITEEEIKERTKREEKEEKKRQKEEKKEQKKKEREEKKKLKDDKKKEHKHKSKKESHHRHHHQHYSDSYDYDSDDEQQVIIIPIMIPYQYPQIYY